MIGVDIVDLTDPLLKKRNSRALGLISHPQDSCPFATSDEELFWLYWTAKEAIFKAYRLPGGLPKAFSPKSIPVVYHAFEDGKMWFDSNGTPPATGYTQPAKEQLLSVATLGAIASVRVSQYVLGTSDHSQELRGKFDRPIVSGQHGLPEVVIDEAHQPVSLSHHHRLGAVAWMGLKRDA